MLKFLLILLPLICLSQSYSDLWGKNGEKWDPTGRLPDFSFAGRANAHEALASQPKRIVNIKDFGAKGDGQHDDTEAFKKAVESVGNAGIIFIPKGKYLIKDFIRVKSGSIIFRGEDPRHSILYFPKPLTSVKPNWGATTSGKRTSNYSWSGGYFSFQGNHGEKWLAKLVKEAELGSKELYLSSVKNLKVGQRLILQMSDSDSQDLTHYLYSHESGDISKLRKLSTRFIFRIEKIAGNKIKIDRPLRYDVKIKFKPTIKSYTPTLKNCGVENLSFEFPETAYKGHFSELGFNAIAFSKVSDSWVKNVTIRNADGGIFLNNSHFCTLSGVTFESQRELSKEQCTGHHGILLSGTDNLFTNFNFKTRFIHDLTVTNGSEGNVFSDGRAMDITMDHHRKAPYGNLFTNIDVGKGNYVFKSGGGRALGRHAGGRNTYWNLYKENGSPVKIPSRTFGPYSLNFIYNMGQGSQTNQKGYWLESLLDLEPKNIHKAQLKKRQQ